MLVNDESRFLINYVLSKKLGLISHSLPDEKELATAKRKQRLSEYWRSYYRYVSEAPFSEAESDSKRWLEDYLQEGLR